MVEPLELDLSMLNNAFCELVPHSKALGLSVLEISSEPAAAVMKLPWHPRLIGNPKTRAPHGGAVTTLIDSCCGVAVYLKINALMPIATLDLRVDSLRPADPDRDLFSRAECYRATRNIAFVRAIAYQAGEAHNPIASAAATFMLSTKGHLKRTGGES